MIIENITTESQKIQTTNTLIQYRKDGSYLEIKGTTVLLCSKNVGHIDSSTKQFNFIGNVLFDVLDKDVKKWIRNTSVKLYAYLSDNYRRSMVVLPNGTTLLHTEAKKWFNTQYKSICEGRRLELTYLYCQLTGQDSSRYITKTKNKKRLDNAGRTYIRYGTKLSKHTILDLYLRTTPSLVSMYYLPMEGVLRES